MKSSTIIVLVLMLAATSGCSHLERILRGASRDKGTAEARVTLPEYPAELKKTEPHAPLVVGTEIRSILKRERAALNRANDRIARGYLFYQDLRLGLK